jgi:hypothetical protein
MRIYHGLFLLFAAILPLSVIGQDAAAPPPPQDIDPSKPTNLYTQVNIQGEYTSAKHFDLMGTRINLQYAFNPNNLLLAEIPVLHHTGTNATGLADMRARYFNKFHVNANSRLNALVAGVDVTMPTGSRQDGLGTGTWTIAPTMIGGVKITDRIFAFPGVSYVHITAPQSPEGITTYASNGFGLQTNMSISFSKRTFLFVNPIYTWLSTNGQEYDVWSGEFNLNRIIKPNKLKVNAGWSPNFTTRADTFRVGFTIFV